MDQDFFIKIGVVKRIVWIVSVIHSHSVNYDEKFLIHFKKI